MLNKKKKHCYYYRTACCYEKASHYYNETFDCYKKSFSLLLDNILPLQENIDYKLQVLLENISLLETYWRNLLSSKKIILLLQEKHPIHIIRRYFAVTREHLLSTRKQFSIITKRLCYKNIFCCNSITSPCYKHLVINRKHRAFTKKKKHFNIIRKASNY